MSKTLKTISKIILGIFAIGITTILVYYLFADVVKVHEFILKKWFPLLSCFIGFYIAGRINEKTKLVFLLCLYLSLLIFIPFRYFYFPYFFLVILFSSFGLIVTRKEINRKYKILTLTISILLFGFYLFSQPLIIEQKGFGSDVNKNLVNAQVLWDFTSKTPPRLPNEVFEDENGNEIKLNEFAGKNLYISFWATWCGPCISEKPFLKKLKEDYSKNNNLIFVDISIDKNKKKWKNYLNNNNPKGIQLITKNEVKTGSNFQFDGIPFNLLVNSEGLYKECPRPSTLKKNILSSSMEINKYILSPRKILNIPYND